MVMHRCQRSHRLKQVLLGVLGFLLIWSLGLGVTPSWASTHTYQEQPGQVTYRSQQSLRDRQDRAWQAVFFKRLRAAQASGLYLRLVGFPGAVEVLTDQPLQITTSLDQIWLAPSALEGLDLPKNVGQYDLRVLMAQLQADLPLRLMVPLTSTDPAEIVVPPFVVQEWRAIANQQPGDHPSD